MIERRIPRAPSGNRIGEAHHRARYSDATVARARELREQGHTYAQIAAAVGAHWRTVADWCQYATRYNCATGAGSDPRA